MTSIADIDALVAPGRYGDRWGWHDDHAALDGTDAYRPALQQVRGEFAELLDVINAMPRRGYCLQLGLGQCHASHDLWRTLFDHATTIDWDECLIDDHVCPGCDTRSPEAKASVIGSAPFDLLFIDADHSAEGACHDHVRYAPLVRPGGLIVFHDALPRAQFPDLRVHEYLAELSGLHFVGSEVGYAWYMAE